MKKIIILLLLISVLVGSGCAGFYGSPEQPVASFVPSVTGSARHEEVTPKANNPQNTQSGVAAKASEWPDMTPSVIPEISLPQEEPIPEKPPETAEILKEDGVYTTSEEVGLYIHLYGKLPENFITKQEAQKLGWSGGSLEPYAPNYCIGGNRFGNYEGLLPEMAGRTYTECDIDTLKASSRGAKRIVFSNDGLIYYTNDHYESFILLYGDEDE